MTITHPAFLDDSYLTACAGKILQLVGEYGIVLDQTNFYATSGGQPGDTGSLETSDGRKISIVETKKGPEPGQILLMSEDAGHALNIGDEVTGHIDWERRYRLMRMHTACHILSVVCPYPITSANVGEVESRIDFDWPDIPTDKVAISQAMMELVNGNHSVFSEWIDEAELEANPGLVKSKNVKPPSGAGKIRLVCIGEDSSIDSQPCGGTHVTETNEVGEIHVGKIENKGKQNRRFRIRFGPLPV